MNNTLNNKEGKMKYQVIVGNIGTVYDGNNKKVAKRTFKIYQAQSEMEFGRASGEDVSYWEHDEPVLIYNGINSEVVE